MIFVGVDFHEAIRAGLFGNVGFFTAAAGKVAGVGAGAGATKVAAGTGAMRPPILGLFGIFLVQRGWSKFSDLRAGSIMALTGDCPNCAEPVYTFLPSNKPEARQKSECHVCNRGIVFQANIARNDQSPWGRVATGRIYLVSRTDDYYDDGTTGSGMRPWPATKSSSQGTQGENLETASDARPESR